jgi:hypothetical protein
MDLPDVAQTMPTPAALAPASSGPSAMSQHAMLQNHAPVNGSLENPLPSCYPNLVQGEGSSFEGSTSLQVNSQQPLLWPKPAGSPEQPSAPRPVDPYDTSTWNAPPAAAALPTRQPAPPVPAQDLLEGQAAAPPQPQPHWPVINPDAQQLPAPPPSSSQPHPQGDQGLIEALERFAASGKLLFDRYVVRGAQDRRFGSQGVVQFAHDPHTQQQYVPASP